MSTDYKDGQDIARDSGELKVHYHLSGGAHRMDALVRNRAEGELLALLKEVGAVLGLPVHVETHAYGEGDAAWSHIGCALHPAADGAG